MQHSERKEFLDLLKNFDAAMLVTERDKRKRHAERAAKSKAKATPATVAKATTKATTEAKATA